MKLRVFDTIAIPSPPKEKLSESQKNFAPPPHTHGKNGMAPAYVERKDCPHKKYPHRGNSPPPDGFFLVMLPPPGELLYPPLCAPIMIYDLHSLYSVCSRELEKKINKN